MFYSNNLKNNNHVKHCFFSRKNGASEGIYESLNCGIGSKDKKENVKKNLEVVAKNFKIEKKSYQAIEKNAERLSIISQERITEELNKIMSDKFLSITIIKHIPTHAKYKVR